MLLIQKELTVRIKTEIHNTKQTLSVKQSFQIDKNNSNWLQLSHDFSYLQYYIVQWIWFLPNYSQYNGNR